MAERSEVKAIKGSDRAALTEHIRQCLDALKAHKPEDVLCILSCVVTQSGKVEIGMLGADMDIAKMLMSVTTVARNGVVQANTPSNPNNESTH